MSIGSSLVNSVRPGKLTVKRLPAPTSLVAVTRPPCSSTSWRTSDRPSPRPPWRRLDEESAWRKRSNICGRKSARDAPPGVLHVERQDFAAPGRSRRVTRPPASVNFTAFESRFQMICCTRSASPIIQGAATSKCFLSSTPRAAAAGATTSIAASAIAREIDRLQLEPQLAAHDPRHVEHVVDQAGLGDGVAIDDLAAPASSIAGSTWRPSRILVQPSTALSGVRISCDSVARNSSLTRTASSATARADSDGLDLVAQLALAGDALADVLDDGDGAEDRAVRLERRDARALQRLDAAARRSGSGGSGAPARRASPVSAAR